MSNRLRRRPAPCLALALAVTFGGGPAAAADVAVAREAYAQGRFGAALTAWQAALPAQTGVARVDTLLDIAAAESALGRVHDATRTLDEAAALAARLGAHAHQALALGAASDAHLLARQLASAERHAENAVTLARESGGPLVAATTLNHRGNVHFARERFQQALADYDAALALADAAGDRALLAKLEVNRVHARLALDRDAEALAALRAGLERTHALPSSHAKALDLLALGHLAERIEARAPELGAVTHAFAALSAADALADELGDSRTRSYAKGHLAALYGAAGRLDEADALLRRALFHAGEADAPELRARWHRQRARTLRTRGRTDEAIAEYRAAIEALRGIQPALLFGTRGHPRSFRETVGSTYLELAELLLPSSSTPAPPGQDALREIRRVMEEFKAVELKNYFRDDCVAAQQARNRSHGIDDLMTTGTATLYPVVFEDRIVLLLTQADGRIEHFVTDVPAADLEQAAIAFRQQMNPSSNPRRLLRTARTLHDWLIGPIEPSLAAGGVDTLVVVPDGILRTIPFAALHDGRDFLVSRYALAITPGLALTDRAPTRPRDSRMLLAGLSAGVQGFDALPHVGDEIERIASGAPAETRLVDESFRKAALIGELERTPYETVLFSTHGRLDADPAQSFVLTYDDRLTLDELEQFIRISEFRERPVELLVLSACETAIGDERAALGLAGVAVKAGARSAMASLWAVNDSSTATLVPAFFDNLEDPSLTKARALQLAQRELLADPSSAHPYYWAPFILIGNWL